MKKYIVEVSETAEQDLENIISYLRYTLSGDIVDDEKSKAFVVRIGHAFMDWEKYLKDN